MQIKQDYLMNEYIEYLDKGIMLGVGAVFLYHANIIKTTNDMYKFLKSENKLFLYEITIKMHYFKQK